MYRSFWTSEEEPRAIDKKLVNSLSDLLSNPSAIFDIIETDALLIWEVNPYNSSLGNLLVKLYILFVNLRASFQTGNSSNDFIVDKDQSSNLKQSSNLPIGQSTNQDKNKIKDK